MNKLDLNAYGVSEMTQEELVNIDGGWKMFGKNYDGNSDCGFYIRTFLWIPIGCGYTFC
jgi:hypothetical protein